MIYFSAKLKRLLRLEGIFHFLGECGSSLHAIQVYGDSEIGSPVLAIKHESPHRANRNVFCNLPPRGVGLCVFRVSTKQ